MLRCSFILALLSALAGCGQPAGGPTPDFASELAGFERLPGFYDLYWDEQKGRLIIGVDRFGEDFLYQSSLARGVGSNDLGLDRGQLGSTRVVRFLRSGPKILLIQDNLDY
ncbi:MAG: peptidase, partial [Gammaproteobacteria bacterium]|nr:peptidase [Gammaproteobacteria bacterium]